jgi:hypothetical protein
MGSFVRVLVGTCAWMSLSVFAWAQAGTPAPAAAGLQPDWDVSVILGEMGDHATRLLPTLDKVDAKSWVQKGASDTYAAQLQSSKDQARAMATDAKALARNPEKLSACLELFFRIQGLEQMIDSLVPAIRKYQSAQLADELGQQSAENGVNRGRFQTYIISLATQREQECAVMDKEAQRCRSIVATQPPPTGSTGRKK